MQEWHTGICLMSASLSVKSVLWATLTNCYIQDHWCKITLFLLLPAGVTHFPKEGHELESFTIYRSSGIKDKFLYGYGNSSVGWIFDEFLFQIFQHFLDMGFSRISKSNFFMQRSAIQQFTLHTMFGEAYHLQWLYCSISWYSCMYHNILQTY